MIGKLLSMQNNREFASKVIFVTGCASGIGLAQAQAFLAQGAFVFGADIQAAPCELLKQPQFTFYQADVADWQVCQELVNACLKQYQKIDILLNTAGKLDGYADLLNTTLESWQQIMRTNVDSMFYLTKLVLPTMLTQKSGTIINMASIASLVAGGGGVAYTASKHAIAGFTKQIALDYADQGISVKAIAPGAIQTPMNAADFAGDGKMAKWVADETPVKRWGKAQEVAELTLFLASEKSSYLQGAIVPIDGGWLLK